jgi:NAD(P)-dependent dehydrogenase (short-subunit alcohol dehydrogenase family)
VQVRTDIPKTSLSHINFEGAAYTASKHGVMGLTKSTAAFYKTKGIRCNLVMPGGMNTNIVNETPFAHAIHGEGQNLLDVVVSALDTPMSDTKEVAKLCAFLASTDSSALNGALIKADKGITAII